MRTALLALLIAASPAVAAASDTPVRAIDPAHSTAGFSIEHIFVEHVTGTVAVRGGSVMLAPGSFIPAAVSATLDATTITTDEPDRDRALEGPDYFDAKAFPTWTFTSTRITASGPARFVMQGMLTLHGVAQLESFEVAVTGTPERPAYHATAAIDRHAFGMKGGRLDPVIGNSADVTLDIHLR